MKNITYYENEIFDLVIWCFNTFDVPQGIEAADLKYDLLCAENKKFEWAPDYTFTMEEAEEDENEEEELWQPSR